MKYPSRTLFSASLASLLLAWTSSQAAFVSWSYNWSRVPADVVSADANGTSTISLTDEALGHATNSSDIVATNIRTSSTAPRATPNNFQDAAYALTLRLTDDASGESGTLTFNGVFNGTLSSTSADISTTFLDGATQELTLGGHQYAVTIDAYSPPGPPGINNAGSIGARVEVTPAEDPPPPPNDAPEPSTVLLSCVGLSLLGAGSWRKWKAGRTPLAVA
jgi:hypothetical protein